VETYYSGFFGFIIFILDIVAIVHIISSHETVMSKVIWIIIVLLLPILGFIIWLIFGPRAK
jgi:Phospholipase_D-nuclease N-terminal